MEEEDQAVLNYYYVLQAMEEEDQAVLNYYYVLQAMEEEDQAVLSEVKIEIDNAEEPQYWTTQPQAQGKLQPHVYCHFRTKHSDPDWTHSFSILSLLQKVWLCHCTAKK
jgi:hypothetical protein